ncbi:MAG: Photosystem I reaction center subunit III [Leptolyngbya sp. ERB_1_1]
MQRLFALVLAIFLWFGFVAPQPAHAYNLTPCSENEVFAQRIKDSGNATARRRLELYSQAGLLCGKDDGLPHLITDGNLKHAGEFTIPGLLFLYLTGWVGYAGRSYLIAAKKSGTPEDKEIVIDVPLAISCILPALLWPLLSIQEFLAGTLVERDDRIPVGPDSLVLAQKDKRNVPSQSR